MTVQDVQALLRIMTSPFNDMTFCDKNVGTPLSN